MRPELSRSVRYGRLIRRETTAVLSIWLAIPDGVSPPRSLRHELHSAIPTAPVREADVTVGKAEPLVLGPPFRQGLWLAHNGPDALVVRGTTTSDSAFGDAPTSPGTPQNVRRALPLNGAMVEFPHD
jgi:hypothetical protein